jgi:hypothetical protein
MSSDYNIWIPFDFYNVENSIKDESASDLIDLEVVILALFAGYFIVLNALSSSGDLVIIYIYNNDCLTFSHSCSLFCMLTMMRSYER